MKTIQLAALAAVLATAVAVPSGSAQADSNSLIFSSNGGFECKPQNGVYSNFSFGTTLVRNIGTETQTLICNLPQIRPSVTNFNLGASGYSVKLLFANVNPSAAIDITCTATVSYAGMAAGNVSTSTKTLNLASGAGGNIEYLATELVINDAAAPVNVSCLLPPKAAFGRIDQLRP